MAWRPPRLAGKGPGMLTEAGLSGPALLPTNGGRRPPLMARRPGLERSAALPRLAGAPGGMARFAARDKGPRVRGVMQARAPGGLRGFAPEPGASLEAPRLAPGQAAPVITQTAEAFLTTAEGGTTGKDQGEGMLHLLVRVCHPRARGQPSQAGRELLLVGPPGKLALAAGLHPATEQRALGFTQPAPRPEEQPIIILARVIDALRSRPACPRAGRQLNPGVPSRLVTGQAARFIGEHDAHAPPGDGGHRCLEAWALTILPGVPESRSDAPDVGRGPASGKGALDKRVLVLAARVMLVHLLPRRLADGDVSLWLIMMRRDLLMGVCGH